MIQFSTLIDIVHCLHNVGFSHVVWPQNGFFGCRVCAVPFCCGPSGRSAKQTFLLPSLASICQTQLPEIFLSRVHGTIGYYKSHLVFPFSVSLGLEFNCVKQTRAASVSFAFVDSVAHVYVSMFRFVNHSCIHVASGRAPQMES